MPRRVLAKAAAHLSGYQNFDPQTNGEQRFLEKSVEIGDGIVFDVGANQGDWAKKVLAFHPQARIHCFEPGASPFRELTAVLGDRVKAHNVAVSSEPGSVVLHVELCARASAVTEFFAKASGVTAPLRSA